MAAGVTDQTGSVRLATGPGNFTLRATGPGLAPATGQQVSVPPVGGDATIVITMAPAASQPGVAVSVVDGNGNPLAGVTVTSAP